MWYYGFTPACWAGSLSSVMFSINTIHLQELKSKTDISKFQVLYNFVKEVQIFEL